MWHGFGSMPHMGSGPRPSQLTEMVLGQKILRRHPYENPFQHFDQHNSTDLTIVLQRLSLVRMLKTDDRHTGLKLAKAFLALLSLFLMSFFEIRSLIITLTRYVKLSTHFSVSPATVRGASKVVFIHVTFVFDALIWVPIQTI